MSVDPYPCPSCGEDCVVEIEEAVTRHQCPECTSTLLEVVRQLL